MLILIIEWSTAAGLPTPASHYRLVASVGTLPPVIITNYDNSVGSPN